MDRTNAPTIVYTTVDEAPALATHSLRPIVAAYAAVAGVAVEVRDISLAGRILAQFPDRLGDRAVADDLAYLGELARTPEANIVKLPNISASVPQLKGAIRELQAQGYPIPDYPDEPATDAERDVRARYDRVKGSAVNPVLREGNSDRRAPASVKAYARAHPHAMGAWAADETSHVATMSAGDFRHNEVATTVAEGDAGVARIEFHAADGAVTVLNPKVPLDADEIVDASFMSRRALRAFLSRADRGREGARLAVLDPPQGDDDEGQRPDPVRARGRSVLRRRVRTARGDARALGRARERRPRRPAREGGRAARRRAARRGGRPPGGPRRRSGARDGELGQGDHQPARAERRDHRRVDAGRDPDVGPDVGTRRRCTRPSSSSRTRATRACTRPSSTTARRTAPSIRARWGASRTWASWRRRPQEYGSHDKTFEVAAAGSVRVVSAAGRVLLERTVEAGDVFRMCTVKDAAVRDWVKLAVGRAARAARRPCSGSTRTGRTTRS
jgi:isocitrate dehydrogenase